MRKLILVVVIVLFVSTGSFAAPGWVAAPQSVYSSDLYVSAVGTGPTRIDAETNARENIAAVFGFSISSSTTARSAEVTASDSFSGRESSTTTDTFSSSSKMSLKATDLVGVEIVEAYSENGVYFALAVMNRAIAASRYNEILMKKLPLITAGYEELLLLENKDMDALVKASSLKKEIEEFTNERTILTILSPQSDGRYASAPSPANIMSVINQIMTNIEFMVEVSGDTSGRVENAIYEMLTMKGYYVSFGQARYAAQARVSLADTTAGNNPLKFVRYNLTVNIRDTEKRSTLLSFTTSGREGQKTKEGARNLALNKLEAAVLQDFSVEFDQKFN